MADPRLILILIASSGDPALPTIRATARQALGAEAQLIVDERPVLPDAALARSLGESAHASSVAEIEWEDVGHTRARVRAERAHEEGWHERELSFLATDPPEERARAIGFALASLVDGADDVAVTPPPSKVEHKPSPRVRIEIAGTGSFGSSGSNAGGATVAGLVSLAPRLALSATAGARDGPVPEGASILALPFGGGAAVRLVGALPYSAFELDARADVLATLLIASHAGARESSWQPGGRVGLEAVWFPTRPVGLLALLGGEAAFGSTTVFVGTESVTHVSPVRGVAELGVAARF